MFVTGISDVSVPGVLCSAFVASWFLAGPVALGFCMYRYRLRAWAIRVLVYGIGGLVGAGMDRVVPIFFYGS